jgi:hypothetical protein
MTAVAEPPGEIVRQPASLYQKLLEAAKAVGVVEKDARNEFHRYAYTSIEGLIDAVHDALFDRGILWLGSESEIQDRSRQTRDGESTVTTVHVLFEFVDTATGETLEMMWAGRGDDPGDKGLSKAFTDARKTFIVQQLNLRRGDDTEADSGTDNRSATTVNLIADARGLGDSALNKVLVSVGLPAQQKPYGAFTRIPVDKAVATRAALKEAHGA